MLGFRGHIQTKSRMFSTTLRAIQTERIEFQQNLRRQIYGEDTTLLVGEWTFEGIGHLNEGDGSWPPRADSGPERRTSNGGREECDVAGRMPAIAPGGIRSGAEEEANDTATT